MNGQISALLFDLDGTLADTREDLFNALNYTMERLKRPLRTREEVTSFIGDGVRILLLRAMAPGHEGYLDEALAIFRPYYETHCVDKTRLFPGVKETLQRLTDRKLAIVTNKPTNATQLVLSGLKIEDFFKTIIGGDTLVQRKPSPEPLLEAAQRLGSNPAETCMVGDSAVDIHAGKAAGMGTCGVSYGYRPLSELQAAGADFFVDRFSDLPQILNR